jgi:Metallo-peptidase family M12B Reprolysin-like
MLRAVSMGGLAVALVGLVTATEARSQTGQVGQPSAIAPLPIDENGVAGRRVRDVVAEQRSARRIAALSPEFVALADDPTAYVDAQSNVFYADLDFVDESQSDAPSKSEPAPTEAEVLLPPTEPLFGLHSRPSSTKTIYLDFDGETVSGTAWNSSRGVTTKTVSAFDQDGSPGSFSAGEQQTIREVWQTVAEDYAPFDVNVTTQRPSADALLRSSAADTQYGVMAVMTPDNWLCGVGCDGIAYLNVFGRPNFTFSPAWIFTGGLYSSSSIGNVVSHEVGHNLGLNHDGLGAATYYGGSGDWGPIMGNPNRAYVQWSRGQYAGATNGEDDLALISAYTGLVPDTTSSIADAPLLPTVATHQVTETAISFSGDEDFYAVDVSGYLRATLRRSSVNPNLYARVSIHDGNGNPVLSSDAYLTGSAAVTARSLPAGRYYISVRGLAFSAAGNTNYGSLGSYDLTLDRITTPGSVTNVSLAATSDSTFSATWTAAVPISNLEQIRYDLTLCELSGPCVVLPSTTSTSAVIPAVRPGTYYQLYITTRNQLPDPSQQVASPYQLALAKPVAPTAQKIRYTASPTPTISVEWSGAVDHQLNETKTTNWTVTNRTTGQQLSGAFDGSVNGAVGSFVQGTGTAWTDTWVDVTMTSITLEAAPFGTSLTTTGSVYIGRPTAPQSPIRPTTPRGPAGQSPTQTTLPRSAAPQA